MDNKMHVDVGLASVGPHIITPLIERRRVQAQAPAATGVPLPAIWSGHLGRLAHAISMAGSPPVLISAALILTASMLPDPHVWMWAGIYTGLAVALPLLYLVWLTKRGAVTDIDVQLREQRARPMLFALTCGGLAWGVLAVCDAPVQMVVLTGLLWLQTALVFCITLRWKISVHCAAAAGVATLIWSLTGTALPLLLGVPIIAWSRLQLQRHTLAQTVAGSLLGFGVFLVALSVL